MLEEFRKYLHNNKMQVYFDRMLGELVLVFRIDDIKQWIITLFKEDLILISAEHFSSVVIKDKQLVMGILEKMIKCNIKLDIDKYYPAISNDKLHKVLSILMIGDEKTISFNGIEVNIFNTKDINLEKLKKEHIKIHDCRKNNIDFY